MPYLSEALSISMKFRQCEGEAQPETSIGGGEGGYHRNHLKRIRRLVANHAGEYSRGDREKKRVSSKVKGVVLNCGEECSWRGKSICMYRNGGGRIYGIRRGETYAK